MKNRDYIIGGVVAVSGLVLIFTGSPWVGFALVVLGLFVMGV